MEGYTVNEIFNDIRLKMSDIYIKNGEIDLFIEMDYCLWDFIYRNAEMNSLSHFLFTNKSIFGMPVYVKKDYPQAYRIFTKGIFDNKVLLAGGLSEKN